MPAYPRSRLSYDQEWCWDAMAYGPYLAASRLSFRLAGEGSPDPGRLARAVRETWSAHPVLRSRFFLDRELPVQQPAGLADAGEPRRAGGRARWSITSGSVESPHFVAHPLFQAQLTAVPGEWSLRVDASPLIFDVPSIGLWAAELRQRFDEPGCGPAAGDQAGSGQAGGDQAGGGLTAYIIAERLAGKAAGQARAAAITSLAGARRYRPMPATGEPLAPGRQAPAQCKAVVPGLPPGGVPDGAVVAAALAAVIFRLTGLPDACFAARLDGRTAGSTGAIGPLSRLVPVRPVLAPEMDRADVTAAVTGALAAAERARHVPLQEILLGVPADGEVDDGPLLPVVLSLTALPAELPGMCDGDVTVSWNCELPLNELAVSYGRRGPDLILWGAYDPQVYERFFIEQFLGALRRVLLEWGRAPEAPVAGLRLAELSEIIRAPAGGPVTPRPLPASQAALGWRRRLASLALAPDGVVAIACDGSAQAAEAILGGLGAGLTMVPLEHQDPSRQRAELARAAGAGLIIERQEDGALGISPLAPASLAPAALAPAALAPAALAPAAPAPDAGAAAAQPEDPGAWPGATSRTAAALRMCVRTPAGPGFCDVPAPLVTALSERLAAALSLQAGETVRLQGARASLWALAHVLAVVQAGGQVEWSDPGHGAVGLDGELAGRPPAAAAVLRRGGASPRAVSVSMAAPESASGPAAGPGLAGTGLAGAAPELVVESIIAPEGLAVVRAIPPHAPRRAGIRPDDLVYGSACVLDDGSRPLPDGAEGLVHVLVPAHKRRPARTADLGLAGHADASGHLVITGQAGGRAEVGGRVLSLTELEAALASVPEVALAAAAVLPGSSGAAVVAFAELAPDSTLSTESLWSALLRRAPAAILPDRIEIDRGGALRRLVTAGGTRRRRTRQITDHLATVLDTPYVAPAPGLEERVARTVMAPCLPGVSLVGRYDNFFRLGGSSLGIVKMVTLAEHEFGVLLNATFLFQEPRLADISALIGRQLAAADSAREVLRSIEHMSDGEVGEVLRLLHDGDRR